MKIKYQNKLQFRETKEKSVFEPHCPQKDGDINREVYFVQLKM